jgi:septal ring factor EnvC (AmiA/AmiB activator)
MNKERDESNWTSLERVKGKFEQATKERDELRHRIHNAEGELASTTDLLNSWARESGVPEARTESGIKVAVNALWSKLSSERYELQRYLHAIAGALHPAHTEPFTYLPQQLAGMVDELQRRLSLQIASAVEHEGYFDKLSVEVYRIAGDGDYHHVYDALGKIERERDGFRSKTRSDLMAERDALQRQLTEARKTTDELTAELERHATDRANQRKDTERLDSLLRILAYYGIDGLDKWLTEKVWRRNLTFDRKAIDAAIKESE